MYLQFIGNVSPEILGLFGDFVWKYWDKTLFID